jgi:FkbM family methyltransferase
MSLEEIGHRHDSERVRLVVPEGRDFKMLTDAGRFEHYLRNGYEDYTADLLLNLSPDGALFIDIGAHLGFYTLLVATKNKNSKVMAFEPVPESCETLKENLELNELKNVEAYDLAVSDKNETRSFNVTDLSSRSSFYRHPTSETIKTIEVKAITLDSFIKQMPDVPVVVKTDTEGHELCILEGMRHILENTEDIKLFVEFNPDCLRSAGYEPGSLLDKIDQLGFDIYFIDDERKEIYKLAESSLTSWPSYFGEGNFKKNYFNLLCVKKSRSLSVCFFSHSSQLGGAERSLLELATELIRDRGVVCSVILPNDGPLKSKLEKVGASTLIVDYAWWCESSLPPDEEIENRLTNSFESLLGQTEQRLHKINPDIIVTNTIVIPWGALAASFLGKPHVWFVREFGRLDHEFKFFLPFQRILKTIGNSSNLILTNSNAVKEALFGDTSKNKTNIITIYPYVEIPSDAFCHGGIDCFTRTSATKLIMCGIISESKGQADAISAVRELIQRKKDVELTIVGGGTSAYLKQLTETIKDENLEAHVKFAGFMENPYPALSQADIVLVCSRNEAFGRITLEAMLLKKPVIGTNSGGTPELIREGFNGLLYEPGNDVQLADKIEYLMEHRKKAKELGENAYKFAKENFTKEKYGGKVHELLTDLKDTANPSTTPYFQFASKVMARLSSRFEARLQEKDAQIGALNSTLQSADTRAADLQSALQSRDARIGQLETALQSRDAQIGQLESALQSRDARIARLESAIQARNVQVTQLQSVLQSRNAQITQLESALRSRDAQISQLETAIRHKESQISSLDLRIQQIQRGVGMQLLRRYRRVVEKLLRTGTRRRYYYELLMKSARVVLNEGWRTFYFKAKTKLRRGLPSFVSNENSSHTSGKVATASEELIPGMVSVVIPVYDRTWQLEESIDSMLKQTYRNFEIILVTDGSPKETLETIEKYKENPKIKVFHYYDKSGNAVRGRNKGIKEARGEYVAFQDSDDIADEDRLSRSVQYIETYKTDVVYGNWQAIMDGSRKLDVDLKNGQIVKAQDFSSEQILAGNPICQSTVLARRTALLDVGGFKRKMRYCEDYELWLRAFHFGYKFKAIPGVLTKLRLHQGNLEIDFKKEETEWLELAKKEYRQRTTLPPKIVFVISGVGISGGIAVICQHANRLIKKGYDVLLVNESKDGNRPDWFPNLLADVVPVDRIGSTPDIAIATHWTTAHTVKNLPAKRKLYFVQSDETRFSPPGSPDRELARQTYTFDFEFVVIARWLQKWLKNSFGKTSFYVPNGVDPSVFYPDVPLSPKSDRPRILLEGPIDIPFKGMEDAFRVVDGVDCEVWCVSTAGRPKPGWKCDRFFDGATQETMRKIYSSCDILIKMSRVEGFFLPPLEMMACGGTVITGKVTGYDEYMKHGYNGLVVEQGDVEGARKKLRELLDNMDLLRALKRGGQETAKQWTWDHSSDKFEQVISPGA